MMTFEDTTKTAYSHGLEDIYKLKNIDIKSVRPLTQKEDQITEEVTIVQENRPNHLDLEFDLGEGFRDWIEPFFLEEPIQSLQLSLLAERCLIDNNYRKLSDLINIDERRLTALKGMGHGHIEEVMTKFKKYIAGRSLHRTYTIDFASWILSLLGGVDSKKSFVFLEAYNLSQLVSLSPAQSMEVRRLTVEMRQEWMHEMSQLLQKKKDEAGMKMEKVINRLIKPWMKRRMGFAAEHELIERIHRISDQQSIAVEAMELLKDIYNGNRLPFGEYLYEVDDKTFCVDKSVADSYKQVVEKTMTYFYNPTNCYTFVELRLLLMREFTKAWSDISFELIEKVWRLSPKFRMRKEKGNCLTICVQ